MADPASLVVIAIIVLSVLALAWYTSRRHWNVERQDDDVREQQFTTEFMDEEEG